MKIRLTRLSNDRHRLAVERTDGSRIERELETRSVLLHDLVHYAVEAEAGLEDGLWGLLAAGTDFDALLEEAAAPTRQGIQLAEALVGPMQSVWQQRLDPDRYVAMARRVAPFVVWTRPSWITSLPACGSGWSPGSTTARADACNPTGWPLGHDRTAGPSPFAPFPARRR